MAPWNVGESGRTPPATASAKYRVADIVPAGSMVGPVDGSGVGLPAGCCTINSVLLIDDKEWQRKPDADR